LQSLVIPCSELIARSAKKKNKVTPVTSAKIETPQSKDTFLISPTSSFIKKDKNSSSPTQVTPLPISDVQSYFNKDDSPDLPSPTNMNPMKLNPSLGGTGNLSVAGSSDNAQVNEKLSLVQLENSVEIRKNSVKRRFAKDNSIARQSQRQGIKIPSDQIPEAEALV